LQLSDRNTPKILLRTCNVTVEDMGDSHIKPLLNRINLEIPQNKFTTILGRSGSGKTTIAHTLIDLLAPSLQMTEGTIYYKGQLIEHKKLKHLRGKQIFYIPQDASTALNPRVKIAKQFNDASIPSYSFNKARRILQRLNLSDPTRILNSYSFQLSGGQRQRCLLAMALMRDPELLIFDEPTTALDEKSKQHFISSLNELYQHSNPTILCITHDLDFFLNHSDYIYIVSEGEIVDQGEPLHLYNSPTHCYTKDIVKHLEQQNITT